MALNAASPRAHKGKIQRASDGGAGKWNHSPGPLLGGFPAEFHRQLPRNARRDFLKHLLFDQILAVINTSGGRSGLPHFEARVMPARFEAIEKAKSLNEAQRDEREQAGVRKKRHHAAQAETCAPSERPAFGIADERCGNGVDAFERNIFHAREIRDPKTVLARKFPPEYFRVDFDRAQAAENSEAQKSSENAAAHGFPRRWMGPKHSYWYPKAVRTGDATAALYGLFAWRTTGYCPAGGTGSAVLLDVAQILGKLRFSLGWVT